MKIGIAGPITLSMLRNLFAEGTQIPETNSFPLIASLAEHLHGKGHEITVFALSRNVTDTQVLEGHRIRAYVCPQRRPRHQMLDFFRGERSALRDAMRKAGCEVIHAHWTYEFGAAAVESGVPHVVTAHDVPTVVLRFARHPYWIEKPLLAVSVLRNARSVTAVSPYVAESLHRFLRPQKDIAVVCNGVGPQVFALNERRKSRSDEGKMVFASVLNGWGARKNGQRLIEAFALLRERHGGTKIELWMFGEGHGEAGPAAVWARGKHLDGGIRFSGSMPYMDMLTILSENTDVLVHPALEECHSMAITEAMAIGLLVIGGRESGGVPWALAGGKAGMLVDVRSPESIATAMHAAAVCTQLRHDLARAGREFALARFKIETTADDYEAIIARAAAQQAR